MRHWATAIGAVALVYLLAQMTIGQLMLARLGDIDSGLQAGTTSFTTSSDLCTMLTEDGFERWLSRIAFPMPNAAADGMRQRHLFVAAEPCSKGRNNIVSASPR